jgi:signal transduction histidine kinase
MDLLIDGLAAYSSSLQTGSESFQSVDVEAMLRIALTTLAAELRSQGAEVSYDRLPTVPGDPDRLIQLLENLIRNPLHHRGAAAPRIRVTAEEQPEEWLFTVSDNGPGVEEEYAEAIFRPFERLDGARHPGPGLGLAICRTIVTGHRGRIWCGSRSGAGAAFFFTLPRTAV